MNDMEDLISQSDLNDLAMIRLNENENGIMARNILAYLTDETLTPPVIDRSATSGKREMSIPRPSADTKIKIFPNPNEGYFQVILPQLSDAAILRITDINGKLIQTYSSTSSMEAQSYNMEIIDKGIYFLTLYG